jgi:hypothetical protein
MVIATRLLKLRQGLSEIPVPIRIFAPKQREVDWACRFEIDWPNEPIQLDTMGIDPVQALELAFRMIGASIYASDHHTSGNLMWEAPGKGYGFPVPNNIRDLLVGEDKRYL